MVASVSGTGRRKARVARRRQDRRAHGVSWLVGGRGRPADEDAPPARRVAGPGRREGTGDGDARDADAHGVLLEQVVHAAGVGLAYHRHADAVRPRGNLDPHLPRVAAQHAQPLAVQRDLHRLVAPNRGQAEAGAGAPHAEAVLGIQREHVLHHDAAARAERLALAMVGLRQPGRGSVGGDTRAGRRVAHGEPADFAAAVT